MKLKNVLKIVTLGTLTISVLSIGSKCFAANHTAFSMGARFDGINTSTDATTAAECYKKMGYRSSYSTSPTYAEFSGSANGSKRVESDILFISGHGREEIWIGI